jgi:hypothetical protein
METMLPLRLEVYRVATKKRPEKLQDVLGKIKDCIERGSYRFTMHALDRQNERSINVPTTLYVLKNGYEEKRKTTFDIEKNTWKYAIRGTSIRGDLDIRVIVAFDESEMLVITVMHVEGI